jgi:hypothetical protein
MHPENSTNMALRVLAVVVGSFLGILLAALGIFEAKLLPLGHFLIVPVMIIGGATMGLFNGYFPEEYLLYFALFETVCDIFLVVWKVREDQNQRK